MTHLRVILALLTLAYSSEAFKILFVSPLPSKSHSILGDAFVDHLSKAGHEVTYITCFPREKPVPGVKEIDVSSNAQYYPESNLNISAVLTNTLNVFDTALVLNIMFVMSEKTVEHPSVQALLKDANQHYDIVVSEWMFSELYAGFSAVYRCPNIWFSTVEPHWMILKLIDEMPNPAYSSDMFSGNVPPFSFKQRLVELMLQMKGRWYQHFNTFPAERNSYERLFAPIIRKRGYPVPHFEDIRYNASMVIGNSHESLGKAMSLPANYKGIGGYHIDRNVKPLPKDLKSLLDNTKNGVIYFSMGSQLKSNGMPDEMKKNLLKMFSTLKQTVLWKFEVDLPNRPSNVHIVQWAPQPSILNHPNCVLFITHGGLLSTTEAIHFAKPIIGIPVFADQFNNIDRAVAKGFAKKVDLSYTMADEIKSAIEEILGDPKYSKKAKELSYVYHNRPMEPGKELVHWVEHVVNTGGALHLRSSALVVSWYQKLYLDLIGIIVVALCVLIISVKLVLSKVIGNNKQFNKSDKKRN